MRESGEERPRIETAEPRLVAFVSSVMDEEMSQPRADVVDALRRPTFLMPWGFEFTPPRSDPADWSYLQNVRQADWLIWLVGSRTTEPVQQEVRQAIADDVPILVVRIAGAKQDKAGRNLLAEVGQRVKWSTAPRADIGETVALAISDEIVRRVRGRTASARRTRLDLVGRLSRARIIERWQASGLTQAEALRLADDPAVGRPPDVVRPSTEHPLRVLIGPVGAGKSLCGERLVQEAVARALADDSAPVPVWLRAAEIRGDVLETIREAARDIDNIDRVGATVVIDGADEAPSSTVPLLLSGARIAVQAIHGIRIVITSRPHGALPQNGEAVDMPQLDEASSLALVARVAGRPVADYGWPPSVRDAARRPLFAILIGVWLRSGPAHTPRSTGELLRNLVRGLRQEEDPGVTSLLFRIARVSIDRGDSLVHLAEIGLRPHVARLRETGLLMERNDAVGFALPILTQWFAAQALAAGEPAIEDLVATPGGLDRWRYAIVMAIGDLPLDRAMALLEPMVSMEPGFASEVIFEGTREHGQPGEPVPTSTATEAGEAIRTTTETWLRGLGPTSALLPFARRDGKSVAIGVSLREGWLTALWRTADDLPVEVIELPPGQGIFGSGLAWGAGRASHPGPEPAWPWRWSHSCIVAALEPEIRHRRLPMGQGPLFEEAAWEEALQLLRLGVYRQKPIPVADVERALERLPEHAALAGLWRTFDLRALRRRVLSLRAVGADSLCQPWPGSDRKEQGRWSWSSYSPERLLERTSRVYQAALEAYSDLVDRWFPTVASRLTTWVTLPATLRGSLWFDPEKDGYQGGPVLTFVLDPAPVGSANDVNITLDRESSRFWDHELLRETHDALMRLRPHSAAWIQPRVMGQGLDIFGPTPVTELVYQFITADLKRVKLLP